MPRSPPPVRPVLSAALTRLRCVRACVCGAGARRGVQAARHAAARRRARGRLRGHRGHRDALRAGLRAVRAVDGPARAAARDCARATPRHPMLSPPVLSVLRAPLKSPHRARYHRCAVSRRSSSRRTLGRCPSGSPTSSRSSAEPTTPIEGLHANGAARLSGARGGAWGGGGVGPREARGCGMLTLMNGGEGAPRMTFDETGSSARANETVWGGRFEA